MEGCHGKSTGWALNSGSLQIFTICCDVYDALISDESAYNRPLSRPIVVLNCIS